ncbi:hypothetical protein Y1Q_0006922 [Alligator mississippiensis]|nr:hypothetical protein Y1Q_0006922 [Alligator mississippiensis]
MQPYMSHLDPHQAHFNHYLGWTCTLVECAFSHLKGRWCSLTAYLKFAEDNLPQVIIAASVLHNICKAWGEQFHEAWVKEVQHVEDA